MPKPLAKSDLADHIAIALNRIADEFKRYNDANEPVRVEVGEAEVFRASYERDDPGARELHDFLTGAESDRRRPSSEKGGRGQKTTRLRTKRDGGSA